MNVYALNEDGSRELLIEGARERDTRREARERKDDALIERHGLAGLVESGEMPWLDAWIFAQMQEVWEQFSMEAAGIL